MSGRSQPKSEAHKQAISEAMRSSPAHKEAVARMWADPDMRARMTQGRPRIAGPKVTDLKGPQRWLYHKLRHGAGMGREEALAEVLRA